MFTKQELRDHPVSPKDGIFLKRCSVKVYSPLLECDVKVAIPFKIEKVALHSAILLRLWDRTRLNMCAQDSTWRACGHVSITFAWRPCKSPFITDASSYVCATSFNLIFNLEITLCAWLKRTSVHLLILTSVKPTNLPSNLPSWAYHSTVDNFEILSASEASSDIIATNGASEFVL